MVGVIGYLVLELPPRTFPARLFAISRVLSPKPRPEHFGLKHPQVGREPRQLSANPAKAGAWRSSRQGKVKGPSEATATRDSG
jgi:hypothetical protein